MIYLCAVRVWALYSWNVWHVQQIQNLRTGVILAMQLDLMFHACVKHLSVHTKPYRKLELILLKKIKIPLLKKKPQKNLHE